MKKIVLAFALLAVAAWPAQAQFLLPWRQAVWSNLQPQKQPSQTDPNLLAALNQQSQQTAQMLGYLQALAAQQQSAAAPQYQIGTPPQGPSINYHYHYWMSGPPSGGSTPVYPPAQPQTTPQTPAPAPAQPIINVIPAQPQPQTAPPCPPQAPQAPANPQPIIVLPAPAQPSAPIINIPAPGQPQIAIPTPPAQPQIQVPVPPAQPQIVIPPPASPKIQIPAPGGTPGIPIPAPGNVKPATALRRYTQTPVRPPALYQNGQRVYHWQPADRK